MENEKQKIKYFLYARKSSEAEDRQVASIDAQIDELNKLAQEFKLTVVDTITESKSAKAPGRKEFNGMMDRLQKGEATGILCWKIDRLARNPVDSGRISWMLQQGVIQQIQTYGRSYYPNDNVLLMAVEQGMANQYVRDLSTNVKRGVRAKLDKGEPFGPVPEGYLNTPDREKGTKCAISDPERFPLIRKMWDLMLTGHYNPQQILKIANNEWGYKTLKRKKLGGKSLSRSVIYRLFTNPFYYGKIRYLKTGELYDGSHKPMVTKSEFDRVQAILRSKGLRPAPHTKEFAHTGQIKCAECECQITAEEKYRLKCTKCKHKFTHSYEGNKSACPKCGTEIKKMNEPKTYHFIYYHCTKRKNTETFRCTQSSLGLKDLEDQVKEFLSTVTIRQEYVDWALKHLQEAKGKKHQTQEAIIESNKKALAAVNKRIDGLMDMRANKEIDEAQYLAKNATLLEEKQKHEAFLDLHERRALEAKNKTVERLTFAERALREYSKGDVRKQREIVHDLSSKLSIYNKILNVQAEEPFKILAEATNRIPQLSPTFETAKTLQNKRRTTSFDSVRPLWLGSWDSNPGPIG